ncbi:uncharacterized protein LOC131665067 [Phymastichus coffea]|uniref:uncharacterized protein LOC131665067 n=1 Tax=Phymastichus coffea TaxID=108790 RepID=UPI00273A9E8B|nr:uncharacterized protein LOC131665067 [Phymastichus coffea]
MPIAAGANGALAVNLGYQFNYALPSNLSQLEPTGPRGRVRRGAERPGTGLDLVDVYLSLEDTLQRHGWGDARQCMLRTICELAEAPLHGRADHVLEEIIHLLLTPSEDGGGDGPLRQYEQAELLGRSGAGQCGATYAGCLGSPLDAFTVLAAPP